MTHLIKYLVIARYYVCFSGFLNSPIWVLVPFCATQETETREMSSPLLWLLSQEVVELRFEFSPLRLKRLIETHMLCSLSLFSPVHYLDEFLQLCCWLTRT